MSITSSSHYGQKTSNSSTICIERLSSYGIPSHSIRLGRVNSHLNPMIQSTITPQAIFIVSVPLTTAGTAKLWFFLRVGTFLWECQAFKFVFGL